MIWIQHIVLVVLVVGAPLWDHFEIKKLKANTDPRKKVRFYGKWIVLQWLSAAIVLAVAGRTLWFAPATAEWPWLHTPRAHSFMLGLLAGLVVVMLLPLLALRKPKGRASIRKAFAKLSFFVPEQAFEYPWFAALAVTGGICEEWVCRGFVLHYFTAAPWHLTLVTAVILSAAIFGLNHLYLGLQGMGSAAVLGLVFAMLYLATGTLLISMALHIFVDLRALALLVGSRERAGEQA